MFAIFQDELEARKSLKAFLVLQIITQYSLEHFPSISRQKISKGFLKVYKLKSNILGQIIFLNLTNVHKLAACPNFVS